MPARREELQREAEGAGAGFEDAGDGGDRRATSGHGAAAGHLHLQFSDQGALRGGKPGRRQEGVR